MATADVEIPKTHKAAVYNKPGDISTEVKDVNTPEPGAGEVLIKLYAPSGLSGASIEGMLMITAVELTRASAIPTLES